MPARRGSTATELGAVDGQPAAGRVRRRRAAAARRGERARGARAPVVGRVATSRTRTCGGCPGIFRDVTLLARPGGRARRRLRPRGLRPRDRRGHAARRRRRAGAGRPCPSSGIDVAAGETVTLPAVEPWSAELPRLYDAEVASDGRARAAADRLPHRRRSRTACCKVNGRRVLLRGVNRHEFDPDRGRAVSRGAMRRDVQLMKRTTSTPCAPATTRRIPRFLDLCDELGLCVIDECDLETHGFFVLDWRGNPSDDPRWDAGAARPHAPHGRARQEPPERRSCGRSATRAAAARNLGAMAGVDARARPVPAAALRARLVVPRRRRLQPHVRRRTRRSTRIGRGEEDAARRPRARRAAPAAAVHPVRVRARHGQRARRAAPSTRRCSSATRAARAASCGSGSTTACASGPPTAASASPTAATSASRCTTATSSPTGCSSPTARPRPGCSSSRRSIEPVRIEGDAAAGRRARSRNLHDFRDLSHLAFAWTLEDGGRRRSPAGTLDVGRRRPARRPSCALPELPATSRRGVADRAGGAGRRTRRGRRPGTRSRGGRSQVGAGAGGGRGGGRGAARGARAAAAPTPATPSASARALRRRAPACCEPSATSRWTARGWTSGARRPTTTRGMHGDEQLEAALAAARAAPRAPPRDRRGRGGPERARRAHPRRHRRRGTRGLLTTYTWTPAGDGLRLRVDVEPGGRVDGAAARGSACASRCPPRSTASSGSAAAPARRTRTRGAPRASGASPPPSTSCRRRTSARRRTAPAPRCGGPRSRTRAAPGLRVEGRPHFELTARRWTTEDLDAARAHARPRAARPRLGQPRPRPAGHRLRLLRAGRAARSTGWRCGRRAFAVVLRELRG